MLSVRQHARPEISAVARTKHCLRLPDLRASTLGDESVAMGAVRLALDEIDSRLLSDGLSAPTAPRR
jgi:hypothetical protein